MSDTTVGTHDAATVREAAQAFAVVATVAHILGGFRVTVDPTGALTLAHHNGFTLTLHGPPPDGPPTVLVEAEERSTDRTWRTQGYLALPDVPNHASGLLYGAALGRHPHPVTPRDPQETPA